MNYKFRGNAIIIAVQEIKKESALFVPTTVADTPEEYVFTITQVGKDITEFEPGQEVMLDNPKYIMPITVNGQDMGLIRPNNILAILERPEPVELYSIEETLERAERKAALAAQATQAGSMGNGLFLDK